MGLFRRRSRSSDSASSAEAATPPLFAALSVPEKRAALDISPLVFDFTLKARHGEGVIVGTDAENDPLLARMTDDDLRTGRDLGLMAQRAIAETNPRESIRILQDILVRAPFDSISMMSIGVRHYELGDRRNALKHLRKAAEMDPGNSRIRQNLQALSQG